MIQCNIHDFQNVFDLLRKQSEDINISLKFFSDHKKLMRGQEDRLQELKIYSALSDKAIDFISMIFDEYNSNDEVEIQIIDELEREE